VIFEVIWIFVLVGSIWLGIKWRNHEPAVPRAGVATEKPGMIYFLQSQKDSQKIKIVKSRGELATPLRIVAEFPTDAPNAVLSRIYRDLEDQHIAAGWYDADAVRMYIDHLRGEA